MVSLMTSVWGIGNFLFRGFVFMMIWNWFPHTILSVPLLSFTASLGLILIVLFFKPIKIFNKSEREALNDRTTEEVFGTCFAVTGVHAVILLIGWIITLFI
jgi:hypothetical protein